MGWKTQGFMKLHAWWIAREFGVSIVYYSRKALRNIFMHMVKFGLNPKKVDTNSVSPICGAARAMDQ